MSLFKKNDVVQHLRTKGFYLIIEEPNQYDLLEDCREPFYKYLGSDGVKWNRRLSQMEDGRFVFIMNSFLEIAAQIADTQPVPEDALSEFFKEYNPMFMNINLVKHRYPQAQAVSTFNYEGPHYRIWPTSDFFEVRFIGKGLTEEQAWEDAATRIKDSDGSAEDFEI